MSHYTYHRYKKFDAFNFCLNYYSNVEDFFRERYNFCGFEILIFINIPLQGIQQHNFNKK